MGSIGAQIPFLKSLLRKYPTTVLSPTFWTPHVFPSSSHFFWNWLTWRGGYRGEKPFQAAEAKLMSNYIHTTLPKVRSIRSIAYLDFHSYSQAILYPFAYTCDRLPRDAEDIAEAAWGAAKAARNIHGRYFEVDSACEGDNFVIDNKKVKVSPPDIPSIYLCCVGVF